MRQITELGYLGFEVSNLAKWEQFATSVLGLVVAPGSTPTTRRMQMDEHSHRFILTEGPADDVSFAGWRCVDSAALERFSKHLDQQGITWAWANDEELALRSVQQMLHFNDTVGNRYEAFCGPQLATERFVSPRVASGFLTGREGLGHIVYGSADYPKTVDFAQRVLGLSMSDQIRVPVAPGMNFEVSFMHGNSRHHSMAVAPHPPTPGPHKRMHHFMIEVNKVEDVGFARDRCLEMGQGVLMDIGQHPNDKMISFYGQTPSGFFVEFGWGGAKINEDHWQVATYNKLSEWGHRPSSEAPISKSVSKSDLAAPVASTNPIISSHSSTAKSLSGLWNVTIKSPLGANEVVFDLTVEGSSVTGVINDRKGAHPITEGVVDGSQLKWRAKVGDPIAMNVAFTANIDGDAMSGGAKSPFGTAPFTGTRAT
jgi:biphenyl-2,3-diol 1,2-dioxygenase